MLKVNTTNILNVAVGNTFIQKVYAGTLLIWENWRTTTGELLKRTFGKTETREGLVFDSGVIAIGKTVKVKKITMFSEVIRKDITGRISGRIVVEGYNGYTWVTLADVISDTNTQFNNNFVVDSSYKDEISSLKYRFYVHDTIWRTYITDIRAWVSEWEEKSN